MPCCRNFVCREPFVPRPCHANDGYRVCNTFDFCECPILAGTSLDIACPVGPGWSIRESTFVIQENSLVPVNLVLGDSVDPSRIFTVADMSDAAQLGVLTWGVDTGETSYPIRYSANDRLILTPDVDLTSGILSFCVLFSILTPPEGPAIINSIANVS